MCCLIFSVIKEYKTYLTLLNMFKSQNYCNFYYRLERCYVSCDVIPTTAVRGFGCGRGSAVHQWMWAVPHVSGLCSGQGSVLWLGSQRWPMLYHKQLTQNQVKSQVNLNIKPQIQDKLYLAWRKLSLFWDHKNDRHCHIILMTVKHISHAKNSIVLL